MTKRFKVEKEIFDGYCIVDNTINGYYTYEKQDLEKLCDSLNALYEENEQLKSELAEIKRQDQEVIEYLQAYHKGDVNELKKELKKE